jgi:hypothetical protein
LIAIAVGAAIVIGKQRLEAPGPLGEYKLVNIPRGAGVRDIADLLVKEGVIDQPWTFVGAVVVRKARDDLKSGEYMFPKHATLGDVIATLLDGKVVQHALTPEGLVRASRAPLLEPTYAGNIQGPARGSPYGDLQGARDAAEQVIRACTRRNAGSYRAWGGDDRSAAHAGSAVAHSSSRRKLAGRADASRRGSSTGRAAHVLQSIRHIWVGRRKRTRTPILERDRQSTPYK